MVGYDQLPDSMISRLVHFYRTGPDRPLATSDEAELRRRYERKRWRVFLGTTLGYGFYYVCRLPLSTTKKPMIDAGLLDARQLGVVGSAMLFSYAIGKLVNGVLGDKSNVKRFIATGLFVSALVNLGLGFGSSFLLFAVLSAVNGWFQSMGCAPSVVALSHWFSNRERGTRYGLWSVAHSIGEGLTFIGTATVVSSLGWRAGFWLPGAICLLVAVAIWVVLADRPETYGLPPVADYKDDHSAPEADEASVGQLQREVLRKPAIWVLGLSSALMYVTRYAINNWAILYLQEAKRYSLTRAGAVLSAYPVMGIFGAASSGFVSDRFFGARRHLPALLYGLAEIAALAVFFFGPAGFVVDAVAMGAFGFALGGLLVFLGGLMAVDICSKKAAGTAMGLIGVFSYLGAAVQDWVSGHLIEAGKTVEQGQAVYDFTTVVHFWLGAAVLALVLACTTWRAERPGRGVDAGAPTTARSPRR